MEQLEVVFVDDDEQTILDRQKVNKGEKVKYKGKKPEKAPIKSVNYIFVGWENEEKLDSVEENLILVAKYEPELLTEQKMEEALYEATLKSAEEAKLNSTIDAGNKVASQQVAIKDDKRSVKEIVQDVLKSGKTEVGIEINKDDIDER